MILSMTGYGKGTAELGRVRVTAEIKTLNNRFADLRLRLPAELQAEEIEIRRRVLGRVRRGRIELGVALERLGDGEAPARLNVPLVEALALAARRLESDFGIAGGLDARTVLALPDALLRSDLSGGLSADEIVAVHRAVDGALLALELERRREGELLREEILGRLRSMEMLVQEIRTFAEGLPAAVLRKLSERLAALVQAGPIDPVRLAQEAAFLADRSDITEELVRLEGHLAQMRSLTSDPGAEPVGKRLDFLLQEVHRETNTVNSKSGDLEISRRALALKAEAEKIREQVQNLE